MKCLFSFIVGEEADVIAFPLFKFAASLGHKDAKYTYGQLLIRGNYKFILYIMMNIVII